MLRRTRPPETAPKPEPLPGVTTEHLQSAIRAEINPVKVQVRWQGYVIGVLAASVLGPKVGVFPAIAAIAADPAATAHLLAAARAHLGL